MKNTQRYKVRLVQLMGTACATLLLNGCSVDAQNSDRTTAARSKSSDSNAVQDDQAVFALDLPDSVPGDADQVVVTLTPSGTNDTTTCSGTGCAAQTTPNVVTRVFSLNEKNLKLSGLKPGDYGVALQFINSKSGRVNARGKHSSMRVGAGKTAHAKV